MSDITIKRYRVDGSSAEVLSAWEPMDGHETITCEEDGRWLGRIGTQRLPIALTAIADKGFDALAAACSEKLFAVSAWRHEQYQQAYNAIVDACPRAAGGARAQGEIILRTMD